MDAQAKKKALFRAKLNAQKQEKQRIDSPLLRYNENDQPVCKICNVVIKSESLWPAHQASRKHHEAIEKLKASAAAVKQPNNAKSESSKELPKRKSESIRELDDELKPSSSLPKHQSSTLPPDFFDNHESKRQKTERDSGKFGDPTSHNKDFISSKAQVVEASVSGSGSDRSSADASMQMTDPGVQASKDLRQVTKTPSSLDAKQVKGALPQGFFDDKDADLRARGITPIKPDVKDEYKEFEKLIQEDLKEVDNRLEEEEFDAAETIEEEETVEQRSYLERVEMLRRKKLELRASKSPTTGAKFANVTPKEFNLEDSLSDDEVDDFKVDWRAKHL